MSVQSTLANVIPNDQPQADIFKMKMDHFEELFDWLSLGDMVSLSQTCRRMQQITGYYIKTNYAAIKFDFKCDGIYRHYSVRYPVRYDETKFDGLSAYLKILCFKYLEGIPDNNYTRAMARLLNTACPPPHIGIPHLKADQFKSLKQIELSNFTLTDKGILIIKEVLEQVETVKLLHPFYHSNDNMEFYESFLQYCTTLKRLCIWTQWSDDNDVAINRVDTSWLLRKYPNLEYVELMQVKTPIDELQTFFDQNTGITTFSTPIETILANSDALKNTRAKWNVLKVEFLKAENLNLSLDLLIGLHERGRFKELHLHFSDISGFDQEVANQLIPFKHLTSLRIDSNTYEVLDLTALISVKHLFFGVAWGLNINLESEDKAPINLESIQFEYILSSNKILPLIRYAPKLKTIVVLHALFAEENERNIFNIEELNKERSKLFNAQKITLYVQERVYLASKWPNNKTSGSLVEMRRLESNPSIFD